MSDRQKWAEYERRKRALLREDLTSEQYADALRRIARELGL